jgi:hypothetical protein
MQIGVEYIQKKLQKVNRVQGEFKLNRTKKSAMISRLLMRYPVLLIVCPHSVTWTPIQIFRATISNQRNRPWC